MFVDQQISKQLLKIKKQPKKTSKLVTESNIFSFENDRIFIDCRKWTTKTINTSSYWVSKSVKTSSNHQRTCWYWQQHYFKSVSSLRLDVHEQDIFPIGPMLKLKPFERDIKAKLVRLTEKYPSYDLIRKFRYIQMRMLNWKTRCDSMSKHFWIIW